MNSSPPQLSGNRIRASGPILILAVLFLAATFLAWYFTWFGRGLSDADISTYLADTKNPRHVQHALLQVQQKLERGDSSAQTWYPQVLALSENPETEFRLTTAWLMGFDNKSNEFHTGLLRLVHDEQPIVRRNAALALVRFNDSGGHDELLAILKPYSVKTPVAGTISSTLKQGAEISRGALLVRIEQDNQSVEIRSPLPGRINQISKANGERVAIGDELLTLNSDEESIWEALRALSLIGTNSDHDLISEYANSATASKRVQEQAKLTLEAISKRK
ncbi:MAG TPA: biotin/lipoyl-containing protein [Pyrinomonadaceae bacterium]